MLAESGAGFTETAEINDAFNAGLPGGVGESGREFEIVVGIFLAGGNYGVDEVVRDSAALQCAEQRLFIREIELDDDEIGMIGPRAILQFARRAHEAVNCVSGIKQARNESAADVSGGAGNRDGAIGHR